MLLKLSKQVLDTRYVDVGMHNGHRRRLLLGHSPKLFVARYHAIVDKQYDILPQPPKHLLIMPDLTPKDVEGLILMLGKECYPIRQELLIDVMMTALKGDCRRE
jgi:hypothetical protein